jgi:hypothetical protein
VTSITFQDFKMDVIMICIVVMHALCLRQVFKKTNLQHCFKERVQGAVYRYDLLSDFLNLLRINVRFGVRFAAKSVAHVKFLVVLLKCLIVMVVR